MTRPVITPSNPLSITILFMGNGKTRPRISNKKGYPLDDERIICRIYQNQHRRCGTMRPMCIVRLKEWKEPKL